MSAGYVFSIFKAGDGRCAIFCHRHNHFLDDTLLNENEKVAVDYLLDEVMTSGDYPINKSGVVEIRMSDGTVKKMRYTSSPWQEI